MLHVKRWEIKSTEKKKKKLNNEGVYCFEQRFSCLQYFMLPIKYTFFLFRSCEHKMPVVPVWHIKSFQNKARDICLIEGFKKMSSFM